MVKRGSLKIGENFVGPTVMHPGHAAKPFPRLIHRRHGMGLADVA